VLVAAFDAKALDDTELLESYFVGGRGAARIFLRGGLKLWKQKPCKGKIACD